MKKVFSVLLALVLVLGMFTGVAFAEELLPEEQDFDCEYMAAPAVAGLLLEEAGIDNRYGQGKDGGNYIKDVAAHMGPETDFDGISKEDEFLYACKVAAFLKSLGAMVVCPGEGILDATSSMATATDNSDGTVTLKIKVVDYCGSPITGLDPLHDFYVMDSVIGGPYYFGTSAIPTSEAAAWSESNGIYTVRLLRNTFSSRPDGYEDGWYRIWDIYVADELVEDDLVLHTTYISANNLVSAQLVLASSNTTGLYGSAVGDKLVLTFEYDIVYNPAWFVYFETSLYLKEAWNADYWDIDGNVLVFTTSRLYSSPRPLNGDYVKSISAFTDLFGRALVVPGGGVLITE